MDKVIHIFIHKLWITFLYLSTPVDILWITFLEIFRKLPTVRNILQSDAFEFSNNLILSKFSNNFLSSKFSENSPMNVNLEYSDNQNFHHLPTIKIFNFHVFMKIIFQNFQNITKISFLIF